MAVTRGGASAQRVVVYVSIVDMSKSRRKPPDATDSAGRRAGTLDLLVLKTLHTTGPRHGYAIARRLEQMAAGQMRISQGTIHPALIRLEQRGWIRTSWDTSDTNRRVKRHALTRAGSRQLQVEVRRWQLASALVARVLAAKA
jgi:PadR family transcriptional regulator PadR